MKRKNAGLLILAVSVMAIVSVFGCGGKDSKEEKSSDADFRIPDSLLTAIEGYHLTVDDYHPVNGGIMANKDIALHYPASHIAEFVSTKSFGYAFNAYRTIQARIGRPVSGQLVIIGAKDLAEYTFLTRKDWWYYGVMQGDTLYLEPLNIMLKRYDFVTGRSIAEIGMIQKMTQMALKRISGGRIPIWMREAAASFLADEKPVLQLQANEFRNELVGFNLSIEELENHLKVAEDKALTRVSFFISYMMVENLMKFSSFDDIVSFARILGEGKTLDEAADEIFGMSYGQLLEKIRLKDDFTNYIGELPANMNLKGDKRQHDR